MKEIETIELERLMIASMKSISGMEGTQVAKDMKAKLVQPYHMDAALLQLWTYALTEKFEPVEAEAIVKVPATWWDHFKMSYLSKWLKYKTVNRAVLLRCTPYAIYPKLPAVKSDCGPTVKFFKKETSRLFLNEFGQSEL